MLYQKEIDAIVKRGYKDAIQWIKLAAEKFPDASFEDILTAADTIIKEKDSFSDSMKTDASNLKITKNRNMSKLAIDKARDFNDEKQAEAERAEEEKLAKQAELEALSTKETEEEIQNEVLEDNSIASEQDFELPNKTYVPPVTKAKEITDLTVKDMIYDERADAVRHSSSSETDLTIKNKDYDAPSELKVDLSLPAQEIEAEIAKKSQQDVVGQKVEVSIPNKDYEVPDELKVDLSMPEDARFARPVEIPEEKGLFGRRKKKELDVTIAYLPPKEIIMEGTDESYLNPNPKLNLEDTPVSKPSIFMKERNKDSNKDVVIPELEIEEDSITKDEINHEDSNNTPVDYDSLAEEIKREREKNKQIIEEVVEESMEAVEEPKEDLAVRFPDRPEINTRQLIKDVRSIDVI